MLWGSKGPLEGTLGPSTIFENTKQAELYECIACISAHIIYVRKMYAVQGYLCILRHVSQNTNTCASLFWLPPPFDVYSMCYSFLNKNSLQEQLVLQFVSEMMHNSTQVGAYSVTCTRNMYKWLHFRMFCTKQHPFPRRGGSHPNFLQILHFQCFERKKHPTSSKITL